MNKAAFFTGLAIIIVQFIVAMVMFADWSWLSTELISKSIAALTLIFMNISALILMIVGACQK